MIIMTSTNNSQVMDKMDSHSKDGQSSSVAQMFDGRSVFITGASGFIGRVLLEKLLRSYAGIKRIYILMRAKKNMQPNERLHKQLLNAPIFNQIKSMPNGQEVLNKCIVVSGDIGEPQLGISDSDLQMMLEDESLSIVFHSAATIKFDEPLKVSVQLNLIATRTIIDICKRLPKLVSFCHVSTAYVNSDLVNGQPIEERLCDVREDPNSLIKLATLLDDDMMQLLKSNFVAGRPNTYTYTKALAEHLIAQEACDLPVAIVRPSIVVASWKEPVPGWIDNLNGPTGLILAIGKGLLRSMLVDTRVKADIIPVDIVVNTMVAAAYYAAKTNNKLKDDNTNEVKEVEKNSVIEKLPSETNNKISKKEHPIFHCNSGDLNPITWGDMERMFPTIRAYPSRQVLRYPFGTFKRNKYHDFITRVFVHFLPALIIDLICIIAGKKPQLLSIYKKLHSATAALSHFSNCNYEFKTKNIQTLRDSLNDCDRKELYMDIENVSWPSFWKDYVLGTRRYILKEDDSSLPEARQSFLRAYYIEIGFRILLVCALIACLLPVLPRLAATLPVRYTLQALQLTQ